MNVNLPSTTFELIFVPFFVTRSTCLPRFFAAAVGLRGFVSACAAPEKAATQTTMRTLSMRNHNSDWPGHDESADAETALTTAPLLAPPCLPYHARPHCRPRRTPPEIE